MFTENYQYVLNRDNGKKFTKLVTKMWKGFGPKKFNEEKEGGSSFTLLQNPFRHNKNLAHMEISCVGKGLSSRLRTYHPSTTIYKCVLKPERFRIFPSLLTCNKTVAAHKSNENETRTCSPDPQQFHQSDRPYQ